MPTRPVPAARLRLHLAALAGPPPTDADLLDQYVAARDGAAFAELVRRHGPAVLAVCRRITRDRADADDAFQATFLALARKADRLRQRSAVGGWLFGAAVRAARKALARSCRRRGRETPVGELPDVPDQSPGGPDLETVRAVLEEVAGLSPAYRAAVVLCELEGRTRADAARELGVPEGTLSSRLAAARKVLAARFRDRGLAPAALAAVAGAANCPVLAADAARLAGAPGPSSRVLKLSEEIVRTPFSSKWWAAPAAVLVAIGLVALAADRPEDPNPPAAAPVPAAAPGGRLLLMREGGFTVLAPDGKELAATKIGSEIDVPGVGWLSPDGKRVAYLLNGGGNTPRTTRVVVRDLDGGKFATIIDVNVESLCWAPDGRSLVAACCEPGEKNPKVEHVRIDLVARTVTKLPWPTDVFLVDWSADGKTLVVGREDETHETGQLALMTADGKRVTDLTTYDATFWGGEARLSPDGKTLLYSDVPPGTKDDHHGMTRRLYVLDIATKKKAEVAGVPLNATVFWCCWSPDGKRIAYTWRQRHAELAKKEKLSGEDAAVETEMFLVVADADGSNDKVVASVKAADARAMPFRAIGWR
ncbi:MAG TPA: sigma-70 family RNA polymerase sigma factor [Acidimicrobiales bacterium]